MPDALTNNMANKLTEVPRRVFASCGPSVECRPAVATRLLLFNVMRLTSDMGTSSSSSSNSSALPKASQRKARSENSTGCQDVDTVKLSTPSDENSSPEDSKVPQK